MSGGSFVSAAGAIPWPGAPQQAQEVLFRPEDVRIAHGQAHLTGTIAAAYFLGDRARLLVDIGAGRPLVVEVSARDEFRQGQAIGLEVDARGLLAL